MRTIRNCPVCVVGGCGFLGSHLVDCLVQERGCQVLVLDNLSAGSREFIEGHLRSGRATFEYADITDSEDRLRKLFSKYKTRFVWNYAAHPYIPVSFERPLHVFDTNARGAIQVINAAQDAGCEGICQVSSAELYGSAGFPPGHPRSGMEWEGGIDETYPVEPHSSYGASKAAVDYFVQVRWREAKTPCLAIRQFNCVGERNVAHAYVIPAIARQIAAHISSPGPYRSPIVRLGNNSTRDFLYAGDQARMAVELLEKGEWGRVYNLGSEESVQVYQLAQMVACVMGFDGALVEPDPARVRPWEIWSLCSDNALAYSVIEARPRVGLEEALRRTIDYYVKTGWQFSW